MSTIKSKANVELFEVSRTRPINGLFRLNYFDGRFLTAASARREQAYWDHRAQLVAQIFPAGIAWGLGLRFPSDYPYPAYAIDGRRVALDSGGADAGLTLTLLPGLAFTGSGRPIVVGGEYDFKLSDLMTAAAQTPTVVIDGGTQFAPCVCLAPSRKLTGGTGSAVSPGPYLLLIAPTETPEGEAKVYGNVCASSSQPTLCEADGWRGGFVLSLARFPVDVPLELVGTAWDLRGLLSAYYFDVYEHALLQRWQSPFPQADPQTAGAPDFCAGTGRLDRQDGPIALAMIYVGSDGSVLWVDPWIPRRALAASAAASWEANLRGALTPSAAMARLNQFQCALDESLDTVPFNHDEKNGTFNNRLNLYQRGFRRIPPYGFLPVPSTASINKKATGLNAVDVIAAERFAETYFRGTNVITYTVVAVHDDDIFEDMARAGEKDAVELSLCSEDLPPLDAATFLNDAGVPEGRLYGGNIVETRLAYAAFAQLYRWLLGHCGAVSIGRLANRQVEIVKLVVPLQGLKRTDPIVGSVNVSADVAASGAWAGINYAKYESNPTLVRFLGKQPAPDAQPRTFVFYVKQRLVLVDVAYLALDALIDLVVDVLGRNSKDSKSLDDRLATTLVDSFIPIRRRERLAAWVTTTDLRATQQQTQSKLGVYAAALFTDDNARASLFGVLKAAAPELFRSALWDVYNRLQQAIARQLEPNTTNGAYSQQTFQSAQDQAIDLLMREHAGAAALKLAAIALPSLQDTPTSNLTNAFEKLLGPCVVDGPATLADTYVLVPQTKVPLGQLAQAIFDAARVAYGAQRIAMFTKGPSYLGVSPTAIAVTPAGPSLNVGKQQQMTATAAYATGATRDVTASATWTSSDPSKGTIESGTAHAGLLTAVAGGTTTVTATAEGTSGTTVATIVAPVTLRSITVNPQNPTVRLQTTQQMNALGTFTDGSTKDLTLTVTWSTSSVVATIDPKGVLTPKDVGHVTVTAKLNTISGTSNVNIIGPLVGLAVQPTAAAVAAGLVQPEAPPAAPPADAPAPIAVVNAALEGAPVQPAIGLAPSDFTLDFAADAAPPLHVWRDTTIDEVLDMTPTTLADLMGATMAKFVTTRIRGDLSALVAAARGLGAFDKAGQPDPAFWPTFWSNLRVQSWADDGSATLTSNATDLNSIKATIWLTNVLRAAGSKGFDDAATVLGKP